MGRGDEYWAFVFDGLNWLIGAEIGNWKNGNILNISNNGIKWKWRIREKRETNRHHYYLFTSLNTNRTLTGLRG